LTGNPTLDWTSGTSLGSILGPIYGLAVLVRPEERANAGFVIFRVI